MTFRSSSRVRPWLIAAGLLAASASASATPLPKKAPDFPVHQSLPLIVSVDGKPISERQLRGKIVLVNFWASWCAACRKELPSLERLSADHPELQVITASVDSNRRDAINAFGGHYGHLQLSFASLDDVQQFGALGMPYSVILNRNGREAVRVPRALDWQGREEKDLLKRAQ